MGYALKKTELVAQLAALRKEQLAATEYVTFVGWTPETVAAYDRRADLIELLDARLYTSSKQQLKTAQRELGEQLKQTASDEFLQREWKKPSESDKHQDEGRQPYRSRERASGDRSVEGSKSRNAKKSDSETKSE